MLNGMGLYAPQCMRSGPRGFQIRSGVEAPGEECGPLIAGCNPFSDILTAFLKIAGGKEDPPSSGFLGRERAFGL